MLKGEIQREEERRAAIIERWGADPPEMELRQTLHMSTGYVIVLDGSHTVERNGRDYFIGIDPDKGWVQTNVEVGTILGG